MCSFEIRLHRVFKTTCVLFTIEGHNRVKVKLEFSVIIIISLYSCI